MGEHWDGYFDEYALDIELSELSKSKLIKQVDEIKTSANQPVDSARVVELVLKNVDASFHRKFHERHPQLHKESILGMQLNAILIDDNIEWNCQPIQRIGHGYASKIYYRTSP
ncbi:hypothetical protein FACS1894199_03190 [Bacteroidia bacterium]|nr:hypothetical protein FACS1894199_03190 [Bacteroidia bacterium]